MSLSIAMSRTEQTPTAGGKREGGREGGREEDKRGEEEKEEDKGGRE